MVQIAIDVGGTFTDVVCLTDDKRLFLTKVPTTPRHVVDGIIDGARKVLEIAGRTPAEVTRFIHSTTIATNAILEHKGATTALLLTEGFEDVLEIGRQKRFEIYNLDLEVQTPVFLVPRHLRAGIAERVDADGTIRKPLDEARLIDTVRELVRRFEIRSVAISYLFSFANPSHERRTREVLKEHFPDLSISISSEVDPVFREYERTCLTCFDAYVRPIVVNYIEELSGALRAAGIDAELKVMQSRGGVTSAGVVSEKPVAMLLSGPAGGVVGARHVGALSDYRNLVTVDIGGTSCDVALIREGRPLISREGRIATYPVRMSMVDVNTVGAGGGSLAWRDDSGGLHVGPQSAGSDPGPICYGRGGTVPTVTDASLVLGYLNPRYFAAGDLSLDLSASLAGVERLARQFSMTAPAMAAGIHRIVNERMANEIRLVSVKRGHDPRLFALMPLGGAGPVHGGRLAELLSIPKMVVPNAPGVLSAFGLLVANIEHEQTQTIGARMRDIEPSRIVTLFHELDALCASGSEILFDFTGTSPQVTGPVNSVPSGTESAAFFVLRAITDSTIPNNSGCYRMLRFILPEGSVINPKRPAPVNARAVTIVRAAHAMMGAMVLALPDKLVGADSGHMTIVFGGTDPRTSLPYVTSEMGAGGTGARANQDGIDLLDFGPVNCMNVPMESLEMESPMRVERFRLRRDSGGPGEFRGGLGSEKIFEVKTGSVTVTLRGERFFTQPWGVFGGGASQSGQAWIERRVGPREDIRSKRVFTLHHGDRLHFLTPGGGGYGDPLKRDSARVRIDVLDQKISITAARDVYGVVLDGDALVVDAAETTILRRRLAAQRGTLPTFDHGRNGRSDDGEFAIRDIEELYPVAAQ